MKFLSRVSTGLKGLDEIIDGLRIGDNVVWQVDHIKDYKKLANWYVDKALEEHRRVVYMRFAHHEPVLDPKDDIKIYTLDPDSGFENFSYEVHKIVTKEGEGVFYVFDSLSDLLSAWATDLMVGNFFSITCPYLFDLNTVAYFALLRNRHSHHTIARIRETTQVLLDVYNGGKDFYVQPLKVWKRYSPTMFLPHLKEGNTFVPVANSLDASRLFSQMSQRWTQTTQRHLDYWDWLFLKADEMIKGPAKSEEKREMIDHLCRIMVIKEPKMLSLAKKYLTLQDLLNIKDRLIGTGFIGGKTVGMLLSRKILTQDTKTDWQHYFEPHDSFYIGSDVFYTYIVQNGWWKLRMEQKTKEGFFDIASKLREKMLTGVFPEEIKEQFFQVIEYFGQSPIIVRSSSLLEDSFGNAFAGKYESLFCANQGSPEQRYEQFEDAVREVFASTMNEDALTYRLQRGLEQHDEQMALLVQRVSGSYRKHYFFPDAAGVGLSFNTFIWKKGMDPKAGVLRLVFGLGTRAVNRVEGDYPRMIALDEPMSKPHAGMKDIRTFSQRNVDVINIEENSLQTVSLYDLLKQKTDIPLEQIAMHDSEASQWLKEKGKTDEAWIITFDELISKTSFPAVMQNMMKYLERVYRYPLEIEFTLNFAENGDFRINLLQCRPLQTFGQRQRLEFPKHINKGNVFFKMDGNFMGGNASHLIKRVIYIEPKAYSSLPLQEKYEVARVVGDLNKMIKVREELPTMLLGPGRWGTTTPSLGVPVHFSEINNVSVLGEVAYLDGKLMPELSFGTHFFQDLVENEIFFVAIFPWEKGVTFNTEKLMKLEKSLKTLLPHYAKYSEVVKVYDMKDQILHVVSDVVAQKVICFYGE